MMFCFSIGHVCLTRKPTATRTATNENSPSLLERPILNVNLFRILWCREGGANPHEGALGGF